MKWPNRIFSLPICVDLWRNSPQFFRDFRVHPWRIFVAVLSAANMLENSACWIWLTSG